MANAGRWSRLLARIREALEPAPDHYDILDTGLARRMGGLLWLGGGLVARGPPPPQGRAAVAGRRSRRARAPAVRPAAGAARHLGLAGGRRARGRIARVG